MRVLVIAVLVLICPTAQAQRVRPVLPPAVPAPFPIPIPWITTSCWVEPHWFETLRAGPVDFCKRSLRFRPGKIDCLAITDEVCWAFNRETGEWTQLRSAGRENLIVCPAGPEPPTCPRLR